MLSHHHTMIFQCMRRAEIQSPVPLVFAITIQQYLHLGRGKHLSLVVNPGRRLSKFLVNRRYSLHPSQATYHDEVRRPLADTSDATNCRRNFIVVTISQKLLVHLIEELDNRP